MRVVLDTNVIVAAIRSSKGGSAYILRQARAGRITTIASVALCLEYEAACLRAEHLDAARATAAEVRNVLDVLAGLCEPVDVWFRWRPQLRDPSDELVLEAAVNGQAAAIVTFNSRDFLPQCERFGINAITPAEMIRRLA